MTKLPSNGNIFTADYASKQVYEYSVSYIPPPSTKTLASMNLLHFLGLIGIIPLAVIMALVYKYLIQGTNFKGNAHYDAARQEESSTRVIVKEVPGLNGQK